eukprot:2821570-Amphidinium_carterae.1
MLVSPADQALVRSMGKEFATFDCSTECLRLEKAVYGLRDAPRAWEVKLKRLLKGLNIRSSITDSRVYFQFLQDVQGNTKLHSILSRQLSSLQQHLPILALTTHVDDL